MSTPTVEYTTGKRGKDNVIVDGQRYTFNRQRNGTDGVRKSYWTCVVPGCNARLVLHDQTVKKNPQHGHDEQRAEITVHRAKKRLKEQAATSDMSTTRMVAEAVSGLDYCLGKMARSAKQTPCQSLH